MTRLLAAMTMVTLFAAAAPARAGKAGREVCADDVTRFCAAAGKKRKAIRACLTERRTELSDACRLST